MQSFVTAINISFSIVSLLCSSTIIILYLSLKKIRTFSQKLVLLMSISDIVSCVGSFFGSEKSGVLCYVQSMLLEFGQLSSVLWTMCMSITLFLVLFLKKKRRYRSAEKYFHVLCWGLPIVMIIIALSTSTIGTVGGYCWISPENWQFLHFYGILWFVLKNNL